MARLIKCDKCGAIVEPTDYRSISVQFGYGPASINRKYTYNGKEFPAALSMDVCINCWKLFIDQELEFFDAK
jgi:DNA-directed RNA polymerase subunit RPC12/RpoP